MVFPSKKQYLLIYLSTSPLILKHSEKDTKKYSFPFHFLQYVKKWNFFSSQNEWDSWVGGCLHNIQASYLNKRKAIHPLFALGLMKSESKKFTTGVSLPILDFLSTTEQTLLQTYFQTAELICCCDKQPVTVRQRVTTSFIPLPRGKDSSALNQDTNPGCLELLHSTVFTPLSLPLQITVLKQTHRC